MAVKDILDKRIIDLCMKVNTKEEAILHLSNILLEANYITNVDEFISDIYMRESEGITGIGDSIAIPHGKSNSVVKVGIAIGKCENSIEWESIDEKPINLIFLFAVPLDDAYEKNHLKLLSELAMKLGNKNSIDKLQTIKTFEELSLAFE